ncbi:hypothetical protein [uncultured Vagococcus sp.]|uniref:hypothetical protein n=1 Tax=uncultured Vagococcus sp. TaxID=189676 RepID=UPI0028D57C62|nr:hypothetical protein [uncultured Vagococcus sp.]
MAEKERNILTKKNQPIKTIVYQDIYATKETLEKLQSWENTLKLFVTFFAEQRNKPLNKKEIIQHYHAASQVFGIFFDDFTKQTSILESQLEALRTSRKVGD